MVKPFECVQNIFTKVKKIVPGQKKIEHGQNVFELTDGLGIFILQNVVYPRFQMHIQPNRTSIINWQGTTILHIITISTQIVVQFSGLSRD